MYGKNSRPGVFDGAWWSTCVSAALLHAVEVSSSWVTHCVPVNCWYTRPSNPLELPARLGFLALVIVRTPADQVWPRFVERETCSVQSVPAIPPTRSHQAIQTVLESIGSTAIERSAPRRSCPMNALKRTNWLVATRWPMTPSPRE